MGGEQGNPMQHPHLGVVAEAEVTEGSDLPTLHTRLAELQGKYAQQPDPT